MNTDKISDPFNPRLSAAKIPGSKRVTFVPNKFGAPLLKYLAEPEMELSLF